VGSVHVSYRDTIEDQVSATIACTTFSVSSLRIHGGRSGNLLAAVEFSITTAVRDPMTHAKRILHSAIAVAMIRTDTRDRDVLSPDLDQHHDIPVRALQRGWSLTASARSTPRMRSFAARQSVARYHAHLAMESDRNGFLEYSGLHLFNDLRIIYSIRLWRSGRSV